MAITITPPGGQGFRSNVSSARSMKAPKATTPKGGRPPKGPAKATANPLLNPSQTLSGPALQQAAGSIADAQTKGPITELAKQIAQQNASNAAEQKQDFGYYMSLAQAAKDAVGQQGQVSAGLNQTLAGIGQNTQGQLAALGQGATGGALARMQGLGLDAGQTQALGAETAAQQRTGALNAQTFQSTGATMGASNQAQGLSQLSNTGLQGQEQIGALAKAGTLANEPLQAKIAALDASKGALTATALGQLRTQERNYQIAQEGLGIKSQSVQTTAANDAARNALTASGQKITAANDAAKITATLRGQNITSQNDLANQAAKSASLAEKSSNDAATQAWRHAALIVKQGGKGVLTQNEQNKIYTQLGEVVNAIPHLQQNGIKNSKGVVTVPHPSEAQIKGLLGSGYNPVLIEAAYELQGWGGITAGTARNLRAMGLRGGTFRGQPIKIVNPQAIRTGSLLGSVL